MLSLDIVFDALDRCEISASDFIITLLTSPYYQDHGHHCNLVSHCSDVFLALLHHSDMHDKLAELCFDAVKETYHQELHVLASEDNGWHFGASRVTTKQMEEFSLTEMAENIELNAPEWRGVMMDDETKPEDTEDYWDEIEEVDLEGFINNLAEEQGTALSAEGHCQKRHLASAMMKKTLISGIIVHGMNQKANLLQSLLGFFIDTFAWIGVSISTNAINLAVRSLSVESENTLKAIGRSFLASYAYDNFDVDLKSDIASVEKSNDSLKHLTSGLLFPMVHRVTTEDLRCSQEIWLKSPLNRQVAKEDKPPKRTWCDLVHLHLTDHSSTSWHISFNSWMFLCDLCTHRPEYFHQFQSRIHPPNPIEQIPLTKTPIFATRAMDVNNSTVNGNIHAVNLLLEQGGVTDPSMQSEETDSPDLWEYVVFMHGDLGTGERLQSAQAWRSIESTPWNCLQHVVFIPGLFHLKMACADAIWRCFILPLAGRGDKTSLMKDVSQLRPRETGIYGTKPNFRRMHLLISHAGICRHLDCWRVHVTKKKHDITSLDSFASSEPHFEDLVEMAEEISHTYIQVGSHQLERTQRKPVNERNSQFENALLLNKYFLFYEELSYAINCGNISRVETCIIGWIPILKATGKHKYATHMTNFLLNIHFVYPAGLRQAIQYHILVNPTGRPMKWRPVDCRQVKNGGKGSNRTVEWIILESPLVQIYRNVQGLVEKHFDLTHRSTEHTAPNMQRTFQSLQKKLALNSPHAVELGRRSGHEIEDLISKGRDMMEKAESENEDNGDEGCPMLEDVMVELL
ncbi:hypothetical protein EV363DRAFT_1401849 [Boletus edulis]|nr:hypothetical protein EV363DRAFT_1401849 [Boletus edulis]